MRLLLDTQVAIWALTNTRRLGVDVLSRIGDEFEDAFVSAVTIWEIAIKYPLGKRVGAPPFSATAALKGFSEAGFSYLDVTPDHAAFVETLPLIYADPFDRLLVAQALFEPMRLITADLTLAKYDPLVWLI